MYKKNCCLNFEQQSLYELVRDVHLSQKSPFRFFNMKLFGKIIFSLTATLALVRAPTKDLLKQLNLSVGPGGGTQFCIQLLKNYTGVVDDIDNKPKENVKTLLNNWDENDIIEKAENIADENVRKLFEDIISYYNGAIWFFLNPLPPRLTRNNYCDTKSGRGRATEMEDFLRWNRETEDFLRWNRETEDLLRRDREPEDFLRWNRETEERYRMYREKETKNLKETEKTKCLEDLKKFGEDIHQTFSFALFKTKPSRYSDPNHYALSLLNDIYYYIVQNDVIGPDFMLNIKTLCEEQIIENNANMKQKKNELQVAIRKDGGNTDPRKKKFFGRFPLKKETANENNLVQNTETPQMKTNKFYESNSQTVSLGWLRRDSKPHLEDIKYD